MKKIIPILCANGHNECSPVFALKLSFIMILDLVVPFNVKHFGKVYYVKKMYWAIIESQQIFSAKTDEHKGLSTMFSFKNGDSFSTIVWIEIIFALDINTRTVLNALLILSSKTCKFQPINFTKIHFLTLFLNVVCPYSVIGTHFYHALQMIRF